MVAPGVVSTEAGEYSPTLDVQRRELVFMRRTPGEQDYTLYVSFFGPGGWSAPIVLPFSGQYRDAGPSFSADGGELLFDSRRPSDGAAIESINLWQAVRVGDGWRRPSLLEAPSQNSDDESKAGQNEYGPVKTEDGSVWFYSFRSPFRGGAHYRSLDATVNRDAELPDPSAPTFVAYLSLSADGNTAVIEGRGKRGSDTDLFYSCKTAAGWSKAAPLRAVNSDSNDGTPSLSSNGETLYFASTRPSASAGAGSSNIYAISTDDLPIPCP